MAQRERQRGPLSLGRSDATRDETTAQPNTKTWNPDGDKPCFNAAHNCCTRDDCRFSHEPQKLHQLLTFKNFKEVDFMITKLERVSPVELLDYLFDYAEGLDQIPALRPPVDTLDKLVDAMTQAEVLCSPKRLKLARILTSVKEHYFALFAKYLDGINNGRVFAPLGRLLLAVIQFYPAMRPQIETLLKAAPVSKAGFKHNGESRRLMSLLILAASPAHAGAVVDLWGDGSAQIGQAEALLTRFARDFRAMSVLPTADELGVGTREVTDVTRDVPSNRSDAPWTCARVDDYMATHFGLQRAEFVAPLVEAFREWRAETDDGAKRGAARRLYYDSVRVHATKAFDVSTSGRPMIRFTFRPSRPVDWSYGAHLVYGSLVMLFSRDTGRGWRIVYGAVEEFNEVSTDAADLAVGLWLAPDQLAALDLSATYTMLESPSYYAAYAPVCQWLRDMRDLHLVDPLAELVLEGCRGQPRVPYYLENARIPQAISDELDSSQGRAMEHVLASEIALIVGPPGTGKSYVGVRAARVLNDEVRYQRLGSPILIICVTNHALDQFLADIVPHIPNTVRYGGRSKHKDPRLAEANVREVIRREHLCSAKEAIEMRGLREQLTAAVGEVQQLSGMRGLVNEILLDALPAAVRAGLCTPPRTTRPTDPLTPRQRNAVLTGCLAAWLEDSAESATRAWVTTRNGRTAAANMPGVAAGGAPEAPDFAREQMKDARDFGDAEDFATATETATILIETRFDEPVPGDSLDGALVQLLLPAVVTRAQQFAAVIGKQEPWLMPVATRRRHYEAARDAVYAAIEERVRAVMGVMASLYNELDACRQQLWVKAARRADVIGMTASFAAAHRTFLEAVGSRVCIVEEAGELLECQLMACLASPQLEHLVLIGDHKQLRPKVDTYALTHKGFDVSLFERLIRLGEPHVALEVQCRMRPAICDLVRPFYTRLSDHAAVQQLEHVPLKMDVAFLDHVHGEARASERQSKTNRFEVELAAALVGQLLKAGISPEKITVLTPYLGQCRLLRRRFVQGTTSRCVCTTVDNYQGEENDVVILSLVRTESLGFVGVDHRVVVALSRARKGLYILGNTALLRRSRVWTRILDDLERTNAIIAVPEADERRAIAAFMTALAK